MTKSEAEDALRTWFRDSAGNTQYCFIGAHGIVDSTGTAIGIGASGEATEFVDWKELWKWFAQGELTGGLWLGACRSTDAAVALSPFLTNVQIAIPQIYGFSDSIYPPEILLILLKLIAFSLIPTTFPISTRNPTSSSPPCQAQKLSCSIQQPLRAEPGNT